MRVIADSLGLISEDYETNSIVEDKDKVYEGFAEVLVDDEFIERFYDHEEMVLEESMVKEKLYPNQFLLLISSSNPKKSAICRFSDHKSPLKPINVKEYSKSWGVVPRNKEQTFAYDLLFDDNIPLVSLIGRAGSGKTLMAIAAGLEQTVGFAERKYKKIVVSRPVQPMGKDIGFLPGTMEEKMLPWLMPIHDNLEFILETRIKLNHILRKDKLRLKQLHTFVVVQFLMHLLLLMKPKNLTAHRS